MVLIHLRVTAYTTAATNQEVYGSNTACAMNLLDDLKQGPYLQYGDNINIALFFRVVVTIDARGLMYGNHTELTESSGRPLN